MKMFSKKADEREMQEYMRVERIGFWTMFYGVAVAIVVQSLLPGVDQRDVVGEIVILLLGGVAAIVGYVRKGLWSARFKMNAKTNLILSLIAAVIVAGIAALRLALSGISDKTAFAPTVLFQFAFTFALTFGLSSILTAIVKKRRAKLEAEVETDDTDAQ